MDGEHKTPDTFTLKGKNRMGRVKMACLGGLGFHPNTLREYDNEVDEDLLDNHLYKIVSAYKSSEGCICYIVGMGGQPKDVYIDLSKEAGIRVVWVRSILSGMAALFRFIVASYSGLIKIESPEKIFDVVKRLSKLSMVGVYIFSPSIEKSFVEKVKQTPLPKQFDFGVKEDAGYFFYIVDADNSESATGIYEIVSYGKKAMFSSFFRD